MIEAEVTELTPIVVETPTGPELVLEHELLEPTRLYMAAFTQGELEILLAACSPHRHITLQFPMLQLLEQEEEEP